MIISTKNLVIVLGLSLTAFTIATIVLAVQKSNLKNDLNEAEKRLDYLEQVLKDLTKPTSTTTTTTTTTPTTETTSTTDPTSPPDPEKIDYRLPTNVIPTHYDLQLHPDVDGGTFTGQIVISVNILNNTDTIILHSGADLKIDFVFAGQSIKTKPRAVEWQWEKKREFLILNLENEVAAGSKLRIAIGFTGIMLNKIVGLYSSSYLKEDGSKKLIVTSKFEPTYTRDAFPCFDEPDKKATFTVTLVRPTKDDYHALSNMDVVEEINQGDFTEVVFRESVKMSTYLACFIISDFDFKIGTVETNGIGQNFKLRAFATPQQLNKVDFALATGIAVTEYYIQYFKIEYPLPKLDMVAIPDFVSGAMEHWGLLTYRETALLYDETQSSTLNKQRIANVVAHELAHMWFGNLVTMKWWNDLWLNEGFARYMEYKGVHSVYPDWGMLDQFLVNALHSVMKYDATLASHPIVVQTAESPSEITELFDTITYEKGASIIRMLEDFVGAENFQTAVTNYLNKFKFGNAVTDDLLTEIAAIVSNINVKLIMKTWTEQRGMPVVNVQKVTDGVFKLTQKPFLANPEDYDHIIHNETDFSYRWSIPITYITSVSKAEELIWFDYDQDDFTINVDKNVKWIKLNNKQVGFYRVNYEEDMWNSIIDELYQSPEAFSIADRAHLLNDVFSLADSTQISYEIALDATTYLQNEHDYVPWNVATTKLISLQQTLMYSQANSDYLSYARGLLQKAYDEVSWTVGTDHVKNRLRVSVLTAACSLGMEDCVSEVNKRFKEYIDNPLEKPHPDIREIVYYYGMINSGNELSWEVMWDLFVKEQDANEKIKLMYGLSGIQVPWILKKFIDLSWNEEFVRSQDYFTCIENIALNPVGESIVWDYVRENWPNLVKRFGITERKLGRLIPSITGRFSTATKLDEMESFFAKYPDAGAGTASRKTALENVKINIKWLAVNHDIISSWLQKQNK